MRKAIINLDWLDMRIYQLKMAINQGIFEKEFEPKVELEIELLSDIHSKCTPINDITSKLKTIESLLQGHDKDSNIGVAYQAVKNLIEENNKQK